MRILCCNYRLRTSPQEKEHRISLYHMHSSHRLNCVCWQCGIRAIMIKLLADRPDRRAPVLSHSSGWRPQASIVLTSTGPLVCPWTHRPMTTFCSTRGSTEVKPKYTHIHTQIYKCCFFQKFPTADIINSTWSLNTRLQNVYKQSQWLSNIHLSGRHNKPPRKTRWSSASCSCLDPCLSSLTVRAQLHVEMVTKRS